MSKSEMVYECSDPEGVFVYCPQDSIICHKWNGTTACGCQYAKQGSIALPEDKSEKPRCTNCQRYTYCTLELVDASRCESYLRNIPVSEGSNAPVKDGGVDEKKTVSLGQITINVPQMGCSGCANLHIDDMYGKQYFYCRVFGENIYMDKGVLTPSSSCTGRRKMLESLISQGYAKGREDMAEQIQEIIKTNVKYNAWGRDTLKCDRDELMGKIDTLSRKEDK